MCSAYATALLKEPEEVRGCQFEVGDAMITVTCTVGALVNNFHSALLGKEVLPD